MDRFFDVLWHHLTLRKPCQYLDSLGYVSFDQNWILSDIVLTGQVLTMSWKPQVVHMWAHSRSMSPGGSGTALSLNCQRFHLVPHIYKNTIIFTYSISTIIYYVVLYQ